jgi:acetylglutamate kinase
VVACVAGDRQGNVYNVNADQMASSCAAGFGVERLFFLTDVEGVLGPDKKVIPRLSRDQSRQLIDSGVATGGMQAKLEAARAALEAGVGAVCIAPGAQPGMIQRLLDGEAAGSRLEP